MTHSRLKYDPKKCRSFRIGCDMGDQIYSLMIAKKMGTKAYYVDGDALSTTVGTEKITL